MSNILTFSEAINENLVEENGWIGFINNATLNIPNYVHTVSDEEGENRHYNISLNKTMNNNKHGEFIDMYPDRSLFSFIPKVNKYRNNRLEPNWDYCLTYPYENFYDNELVQYTYKNSDGGDVFINGLSCRLLLNNNYNNIFDMIDGNDGDDDNVDFTLKTKFKNNINKNSKLQFIIIGEKKNENGEGYHISHEIIDEPITVEGVNEKDNSFTVNGEELKDSIYHFIDENDDVKLIDIRVRQIKNGIPCKYYFRKFKKLLKKIGEDEYTNFNSLINKMGFSKTIYSDDVSQILFNDDVDVTGLRDNLGRELSEIYLTIVKNNKGNELWYDKKKYRDKDITYSHCFGKITSGIDIKDADEYDYNIHKIHNVPVEINDNIDYRAINKKSNMSFNFLEHIFKRNEDEYELPLTLGGENENITIDDDLFLGDIVEFSPSQVHETTLEYVKHRFNTRQREYFKVEEKNEIDKEFYDILIDEIHYDDYDITMYAKSNIDETLKFKIEEGGYKWKIDGDNIVNDDNFDIMDNKFNAIYSLEEVNDENKKIELLSLPVNIAPEGYYYQPHYKIPLREYRSTILQGKHEEIFTVDGTEIYKEKTFENGVAYTEIKADTSVFSYLERLGAGYDKLYLYDLYNDNHKIEATIINVGRYPSTDFTMVIEKPINDVIDEVTFDIIVDDIVNEAIYLPILNSNKKVLIGKPFEEYRTGDIVNDKGEVIDTIGTFKGASVKIDNVIQERYTLVNRQLVAHGLENNVYRTLSNRYRIFKPVLEMPNNSVELTDGSGRFLWREFKQEHDYESERGEISKYIFTNGAHYINKGINFFLRRQDPDGYYDLSNIKVGVPFINNLAINGYTTDVSDNEYFEIDEEGVIC